ncbi:transmembrane protein 2-like [Plakobranchus ocellatus]|uniref:Transmembrane protein 2-like n=1 Tax=Plakobranchus ocellatus TaxID=259542 RepID=A0AAV4DM31_9GAST|nr:transmembrane protein 2-like [Plakobranchus ocellatus]
MYTSVTLLWILFGSSCVVQRAYAQTVCPWDNPDLKKWSEASTWPSGQVPQENDAVVVPKDTKVILDTPVPRLLSLTIDGTLIWGDVDGIRLETSYILVNGEFHIGSEDCNFERKADILLYGKSNHLKKHTFFGRKFVGANDGSRLEIHGKLKKSWTKLTRTVGPNKDSCGVVYDSSKEKFDEETLRGLHMVIWNPDGTVYDYGVFATEAGKQEEIDSFIYKIGNITEVGKIIAVSVQENLGKPAAAWESLYQTIEKLGGNAIRGVKPFEAYSLVAVLGHPNRTEDMHAVRYSGDDLVKAKVSLTLEARSLVFSAESATVPSGMRSYVRFRVIARRLAYPLITVQDDVTSWLPGDQIVVTSTDYDWRQAEVKTIVKCFDCASNQIRVDGEFKYSHFGQVTYGVDERAEVALLSRNIRIEGEVQKTCYSFNKREKYLCTRFGKDTFGGHLKILRGAYARIEGVELYHLGQQAERGHYPLHFHMCDEVPGQYFKNNAIRDSFSRCITIHGTDNATVSLTKMCLCLLSSYWITRPENFITDNVAAGGDGNGVVFVFADVPLGFSYERQKERGLLRRLSAQYTKVAQFSGNIMHSYGDNGLWFDGIVSAGQFHDGYFVEPDGIIRMNGMYDPRDPPTENGTRTETILSGLTLYRNHETDAWIRCGNIVISNSSFADSTISVITAHSTGATSCDIRHSIFIGETENKGEPFIYINRSSVYDHLDKKDKPTHHFERSYSRDKPDVMQSAILMYQGLVYVDNCFFDRYYNWYYNDSFMDTWGFRPVHAAAAISFHRTNHYPMVPRNGVMNLKFGYCDGDKNSFRVENSNCSSPYWKVFDGSELTTFHDYDGSLTGTANTQIVRDRPFYTGPECLSKPEWSMAICPYKYAQLIIRGSGGVLKPSLVRKWAVLVSRDDVPMDVMNIEGTNGLKYPVRIHQSYTIRFNTSLGSAPTDVEVKVKNGLEINDIIRVAICFPKSANNFTIRSSWPKINNRNTFPKWVKSLTELDEDVTMAAYFWDKEHGYLLFKMSSNGTFTNPDQDAAGDIIPEVSITRIDGDDSPATCEYNVPPYRNPKITPPSHVTEAPCSGPDSPKGLGAPIADDSSHFVSQEETCADCPVADIAQTARPSGPRGCFLQSNELTDFTSDLTELKKSMTTEFCINKCFQREFPFAGLYSGSKCQCASSIGRNGVLSEETCGKPCTGNSTQSCGGDWDEVSVHSTGFALPPAPARCGPLSRGVYYQGKCLYLNYVLEDFWSAESRCQSEGGSLSKIDTEEKMRFIETYLSNVDGDVWFGAKGTPAEDSWYFLDDTVVTYGNWRHKPFKPLKNRYLYLQVYRRYKWNVSVYNRVKLSLCDLSLNSPPAQTGDCGYKLRGTIFGQNKRCFAQVKNLLTFQDSFFTCKRMFGRMASILDLTEKIDVETYLNNIIDRQRYWVDGSPKEVGHNEAYEGRVSRSLIEAIDSDHYRTLCVLDIEDSDGCASGWTRNGKSCYLNTNLRVTSYSQAASLCNSDRTSLLTIDSLEESNFVKNIASGTVWLDLRYDGMLDNVVKSNGERAPRNFWSSPNNLSRGLCVISDVAYETWLHTPCSEAPGHLVVCEAPVTFIKKPSECNVQ